MTLSVLLAILVAGAVVLQAPASSAQDPEEVEVLALEAKPLVVSPHAASLELEMRVETGVERLNVTIVTQQAEGGNDRSTITRTLVADRASVITGSIDLHLPASAGAGLWSVDVESMRNESDPSGSELDVSGTTSTIFFVHEDEQVAGGAGPVWPQTGGDPQHSGRTLNVGPQQADHVRWEKQAEDDQPFQDPVLDEDGNITAVSWGGLVYRLDGDGTELWPRPLRLGSSVSFPPASTTDGLVLVATDDGTLRSISPDRSQAWKIETAGRSLLSGPVVGPDDTIYVIREPWTLMAITPEGEIRSEVGLSEPAAYDPSMGTPPSPNPGPPIAVDRSGTLVALTEGSITELDATTLAIEEEIGCDCTPRGITLVPSSPVALVVGDREVVAVDRSSASIAWRTGDADRPGSEPDGQIYATPVVGWGSAGSEPVFITDAGGSVHVLTVGGAHIRSWGNLFGPIYGQAAVDANGDIYIADACHDMRSLASDLTPRWTKTLSVTGCSGSPTGVVPADGSGVIWAGPDGTLRMIGKDRPPEASFSVSWEQDRGYVFDARASSDPDQSPLTYTWKLGEDGPVMRGSTVAHRFSSSDNHTIHLTVDDGTSKVTTSRTMDINLPPEPRITDESQGLNVRLHANETTDPDDEELSYWWEISDHGATSGRWASLEADGPRVYEVKLHVFDGDLNATAKRTIFAPAGDAWETETLATYSGDCAADVCTVPASLTFTQGAFVEIAVANGIGRPMVVEPHLPTVPGGPDEILLNAGEQGSLFLEATTSKSQALSLSPLGSPDTAAVPISVRPAPAHVTWRLQSSEDLVVGERSQVLLRLEGGKPPGDVALRFTLRSGSRAVADEDVALEAGQPANRTVAMTFVPEEAGSFSGSIIAATANDDFATIQPASDEPTEHTFHVEEAGLVTMAARALSNNPYVIAGTALLATLSLAGVGFVLFQRRQEETTMQPVSTSQAQPVPASSASSASEDGATVAAGFMPRKVDRFHVERVLGEGGFGTTYLAQDSVLERNVVLKDLEHVGEGDARDLLMHEAKTAANLQHANVVVVHDVIEEEGRLLLVMEYVEGGTLEDNAKDALSLKQALPLARNIMDGLAALHEAGIVHRDLKPSNILITPEGTAKITDFGVALRQDEASTNGEAFVGTPRYMAPEQLAGGAPGPAADVYAAGALVYRMLTGDHHLGLQGPTPPPEEVLDRDVRLPLPGVPDALNEILACALAEDPDERFEDARAFANALDTLDITGSRAVDTASSGN